jgi:putative hemolysin
LSFSILILALAISLVGLFSLTALNSAFRRLQKKDSKKKIHSLGKVFFYRYIHALFFPKYEYEGLFFASTCAQNILRFLYALFSFFILLKAYLFTIIPLEGQFSFLIINNWLATFASLFGLFLIFFTIGDYIPRLFGNRSPELMITLCAPIASLFMLLASPLTFLFLKLSQLLSHTNYFDHFLEPQTEVTQEIIDLIEESNLKHHFDFHDKQLIESVMGFKDRIAREVMVPRVDVFSLSHDTTIEEAAKLLHNEGYSRTPVYKDTLDNIIGVLMYKDILFKYMEYVEQGNNLKILQTPIETLVKNILYTPETKKISSLLQEFRKKQVHLAIIVDEYGGTEGIVTIEDILEQIVGDIADEYDQEEILFVALPNGGWLVDARMNILDIEEELGIDIPQNGDYDTIGGYIFHQAGTIPAKGFLIRQPNFEIEVLRSNDRRVEKVRIQPFQSSTNNQNPLKGNS